jgi:putative hydrolase of the HAD superfamily
MTKAEKSHSPQFKAVIFDYGEVLCFPPTPAEIARMAEVFGVAPERFRPLYEKNRRAYDRGDLEAEEYWAAFAADAGTKLTPAQVNKLRAWDTEMWSKLNPVMLEWLSALQEAGIRTAILSNMQSDMVNHVRRSFPWVEKFHHVVFSHEVRLAKPEPEIYQHCLRGLGTAPHETLFIDDRKTNINAAQALGIQTIHLKSVAQLRGELEARQFAILPQVGEAAPLPSR